MPKLNQNLSVHIKCLSMSVAISIKLEKSVLVSIKNHMKLVYDDEVPDTQTNATDTDTPPDLVPSTSNNQTDEQPDCHYSPCIQQVRRNPQVSFVNTNLDPQPWHVLAVATEFDPLRGDDHCICKSYPSKVGVKCK